MICLFYEGDFATEMEIFGTENPLLVLIHPKMPLHKKLMI